jgi:hypothetical protein
MAKREPMVVGAKIGQTVFMALLCVMLYWQAAGWNIDDQS